MGQSWPEGHSLPTSVLNHRPWRALSGSNWCVNSRGGVMMTMTRTRMTIICQALGWALFQLYYPLHPPMRGIVWPPPFFFAGDKERHLSQRWKCQHLIAGKWQSWWVNTGLLTSKSHTLLGSLITWRPFPFRNELCCPASRIGLHSVPRRWLEPHIHAGWFTLYLRSHSFPISRLVASHHCPLFCPNAMWTPKNLLWRVSSFKSEQHNLCSRQAPLYHCPSLLPYCFPARPTTQVHFHLHTHQC